MTPLLPAIARVHGGKGNSQLSTWVENQKDAMTALKAALIPVVAGQTDMAEQ